MYRNTETLNTFENISTYHDQNYIALSVEIH